MKTHVEIHLSPEERKRLEAVVASGNSPQKHVWRARIVLLSADGVRTAEMQRRTRKAKPTIWRWQLRFMEAGVDGLLRDATRPGRKPPLAPAMVERIVAMALRWPAGRGDALEWPDNGQGGGGQPSQRATDLGGAWPEAASDPDFQAVEGSEVRCQSAGYRRSLHGPAGARAGALRGQEVADPGTRSHPARVPYEARALPRQ